MREQEVEAQMTVQRYVPKALTDSEGYRVYDTVQKQFVGRAFDNWLRTVDEADQYNETHSFSTKDSGTRDEFPTGMVRDTQQGKPRFDLLLPHDLPYREQLLTRFAELMARGAEKYDERNWEQAATQGEYERYVSSALRHMIQWASGERDEDHAAAVLFNLMGAEYVAYRLRETESD